MSLTITTPYVKSEYEKELERAIDTQLANASATSTALDAEITTLSGNITTLSGNITTLSGNITTLSGNITSLSASVTTLSGNITSIIDFATVAEDDTANFTLDLTSVTNFNITNGNTASKTLIIINLPTASDTTTDVTVRLEFTATATITYTGTITWSLATAPNPTAAGTFLLSLKSFDAGVNWLASYTGLY